MADLDEGLGSLVELAGRLARHPDVAPASGLLVSQKSDTGFWIASPGEEKPFSVERRTLQEEISGGPVGSELIFHDLVDAPYMLHAHPALANGLACSVDGRKLMGGILGDDALWIEWTDDEGARAARLKERIEAHRGQHGGDPRILLLQNHGLCLTGASPRDLERNLEQALEAIRGRVHLPPDVQAISADKARAAKIAPALRMLAAEAGAAGGGAGPADPAAAGSIVVFRSSVGHGQTGGRGPASTALTEEHARACGPEPLAVPGGDLEEQYTLLREGIREYSNRIGAPPRVVMVEGVGLFFWGPTKQDADRSCRAYFDALKVAVYAESFGGPAPLAADQAGRIRRTERPEQAAPQGRLAGRIALVTGAAQGFGQGISAGLAAEGANLIIADLNEEGAGRNAAELCRVHGAGTAMGVRADVTNEESVRAMVEQAVLEYGGLDLLVSNAGVLRAGGLEETQLSDFEFVHRVNTAGYFLCSKHAAAVMQIQHRFNPEHYADIIQINSKSGLAGSNRNFSYAGSKFAGIGLTQSFALELVERRIKVNAVCPGNLFEGPLWSDPETGLFVQYLRAGKVPGAKTIEDVRRFYEGKVPMGRGCRVEDVVRAILYLVEQEYETGQALPVTGGQIMLA